MFIDLHSFVVVKPGIKRQDLAGRVGTVERIRVLTDSNDVWICVALFEPETGDSPIYLFSPGELARWKPEKTRAKLVRDHITDQIVAVGMLSK